MSDSTAGWSWREGHKSRGRSVRSSVALSAQGATMLADLDLLLTTVFCPANDLVGEPVLDRRQFVGGAVMGPTLRLPRPGRGPGRRGRVGAYALLRPEQRVPHRRLRRSSMPPTRTCRRPVVAQALGSVGVGHVAAPTPSVATCGHLATLRPRGIPPDRTAPALCGGRAAVSTDQPLCALTSQHAASR